MNQKKLAFTMAEILLSLTIIGVVAAITLPSLTGNINERTWNTQRKALYARFSQAIALMPALNGYGTLTEESSSGAGDAVDTAAETFVTAGLSKVLKINNICDNEHFEDCGIPSKLIAINGDIISAFPKTLRELNDTFGGLDTKATAFETANGESLVVYYRPNCIANMNETVNHTRQKYMCANFIYDLNGTKGPNTIGKDVGFMSVLYPSDSVVVAPMPLNSRIPGSLSQISAGKKCRSMDSGARLPNIDELSSMSYNKKFLDPSVNSGTWFSSSVIYNTSDSRLRVWSWHGHGDSFYTALATDVREAWCVKR